MVVYLGSQRVGTSVVVSTGSTPVQEISLPIGQPLKTEEPFANETKGYVEQGNYVFSTEGDEVTEANVTQTGGTMGSDYVYTGAQGAYLTLPKPAPITFTISEISWFAKSLSTAVFRGETTLPLNI